MNEIFDVLSRPTWQHLATALLHSLWEGPVVMLLLWLLLQRIPAHRPEIRYRVAFSALLGIVVCVLATWSLLDFKRPDRPATAEPIITTAAAERPSADVVQHDRSRTGDEGASVNQSSNRAQGRSAWLPYIVFFWLLGVLLMMCRMAWIVARLRRLLRVPEVADQRLRLIIEELRQLMQIARSLRVVDSLESFGPAVFGFVRPILALPVSMITGLPPDAVRAILAHELAHIRRHDYLFNLAQMVIEAVLYFNPAVWWINRQIRVEREACCDALAASILGQPLVLAEALSVWAERVYAQNSPLGAMAWTGRQGPRLLLDRVRRMVLPGYRPQSPISSLGFLGLLLTGILVLGGLWCGTSAAVQLVEKILTPEERIEKVTVAGKGFVTEEEDSALGPEKIVTLTGTVRTADGIPLPRRCYGYIYTRSNNGNESMSTQDLSPSFSIHTSPGKSWLCVQPDGYAPAIVGPFFGKAGETISNIEIILKPGFPLSLQFKDEHGSPIEGVEVHGWPLIDGSGCGRSDRKFKSDAQGIAVIPHVAEWAYSLSASKPGFQPMKSSDITAKSDQVLQLKMLHAKPVKGLLLSPEGKPVPDTDIRQYLKIKETGSMCDGIYGPILTQTDVDGHFVLDELEDGTAYLLVAESKEFGRQSFYFEMPVEKEISVKFGPKLTISGRIKGDLKDLEIENKKPEILLTQTFSGSPNNPSFTSCPWTVPVEVAKDIGKFDFQGLLPGEISIKAGKHIARTKVSPSEPHQEVNIDLSQPISLEHPPMRQVVMTFVTPDGKVPPQGTIEIRTIKAEDAETKLVALEKGIAKFDAYVAGYLECTPKGMIGYWFSETNERSLPAGEEPLEISIPVFPAGAITGQVLNADDTPAVDDISIDNTGVFKTDNSTRSGGLGDAKLGENGKFFIGPVPLGAKCWVTATRGHTIQISEVQLNAAHPTADLMLRLPKTAVAEGKVFDPDGRPMAGLAFELSFSATSEQGGRSWRGDSLVTNNEGEFRLDDLSANVGRYSLAFAFKQKYQPLRVPLPLDGKPVKVELQPGQVLEGQILDSATGWPVPDVVLFAMPSDFKVGDVGYDAEGVTDRQGRFRFSNLGARAYRLNVRNCNLYQPTPSQPQPDFHPGEKNIVLKVILPDWCKLKPQPPHEQK
jgi:beta-lactamase regulating signal transducer with metallopeptidase domain